MANDQEGYGTKLKTWKHNLHFNLKWWKLDLSADSRWKKHLDVGLCGMTVVGCSDQEIKSIKKWALDHSVHKVDRVASFECDMEGKFTREINNGHLLHGFTYREREVCLFDTDERLLEFELFLDSLPKRELETFVHGRSLGYVLGTCSGQIHRVLPAMNYEDAIAVSVENKELFLQLNLISSEIEV